LATGAEMIDFLQGCVMAQNSKRITLLVGGIGYGVQVPDENVFSDQQEVGIHIYTHWNQDNGPSLFGFVGLLDKQVFELIVGCSGIGPKIGLAVLAHMTAGSFINMITEGDVKGLSAVNGIGAKKAENMIVLLSRKVAKLVESGIELGSDGQQARDCNEVAQVLASLSYSRPEINSALEYVKKNADISLLNFDSLLRKALGYLSKQA
jgi:Holliday junction DNA helicase RuvA